MSETEVVGVGVGEVVVVTRGEEIFTASEVYKKY